MKTALLVGGAAATGRMIVSELQARGFAVTLYNRGRHNAGLDRRGLEFIAGDPHFRESIARDLGSRTWDVTIATYGRTRLLGDALTGRTGQFLGVSGSPICRTDLGAPTCESDPVVGAENAPAAMTGLIPRIAETERRILEAGKAGAFAATIVRYPYVYGPHSLVPMEWHVIQRVRDGRKRWALPGGGLLLSGRCASANAAALIGAAIDRPDAAAGNVYHAADRRQFTQREWIATIAAMLDHEFEFVDIPPSIACLGSSAVPLSGELMFSHSSRDLAQGRLRHNLPSPIRAMTELGYQEVVDPVAWMRQTVDYWLDHPFVMDGRAGAPLTAMDFDYAAEDALLDWWSGTVEAAPAFGQAVLREHPYEHPK